MNLYIDSVDIDEILDKLKKKRRSTMTRFLDTVKAFQHNDKVELGRINPPDMLDLSQTIDASSHIGHTYSIEVRFGTRVQIRPELVGEAVAYTRREIAEFVYDDITKELIEWFSNLRYNNNIRHEDCNEFYKIIDKMR